MRRRVVLLLAFGIGCVGETCVARAWHRERCLAPFLAEGSVCSFVLEVGGVPPVRCRRSESMDGTVQLIACSYDPAARR